MIKYYKHNKNIHINQSLIAQYIGLATISCPGVVGMTTISIKDGVFRLLKKDSLEKGIEIINDNNKLKVNLHIIVLQGVNIETITNEIIKSITFNLKEILNIDIKDINIYIDGFRKND